MLVLLILLQVYSGGETLSEANNIFSSSNDSSSVDSSVVSALKDAQSNLESVSKSLSTLSGGSSNSLTGLSELQKTTKQLKARSDEATSGIISSINGLYTISLSTLSGGSSNSLTGLSELQKTTKQLKARSDEATSGIISSINGLYTIGTSAASGSAAIADGTSQLAANMPVLSSSIKALSDVHSLLLICQFFLAQ